MANLPTPEQAKTLPVPADHRGGLDDGNAGFPTVPDRGEPCPKKAVSGAQLRALDRALKHAELMTQGQDLQLEGRRLRNEDPREAKKAIRTAPKRKRLKGDKPQFIRLIGVYERDNRAAARVPLETHFQMIVVPFERIMWPRSREVQARMQPVNGVTTCIRSFRLIFRVLQPDQMSRANECSSDDSVISDPDGIARRSGKGTLWAESDALALPAPSFSGGAF